MTHGIQRLNVGRIWCWPPTSLIRTTSQLFATVGKPNNRLAGIQARNLADDVIGALESSLPVSPLARCSLRRLCGNVLRLRLDGVGVNRGPVLIQIKTGSEISDGVTNLYALERRQVFQTRSDDAGSRVSWVRLKQASSLVNQVQNIQTLFGIDTTSKV